MIKAVIFDMDGVLIQAKDWHYEALNRALRLFGYEISRYEHYTTYDGLPTSKKLDMLSLERGLPRGLHSFINELKQTYTMELVHARCRPRFVHEYALSQLKARGYHLALASNAVRQSVEVMMSKAKLLSYFDYVLSAADVPRAKPDPAIYVEAIRRLGLSPAECLAVEDNRNGIKAATASGAHVMVVEQTDEVTLENILASIAGAERAVAVTVAVAVAV